MSDWTDAEDELAKELYFRESDEMTDMTQYIVREHTLNGGSQTVYKFDNGYGASVICGGWYTYGDDEAPYELAVLKFYTDKQGFGLCYDTPITDDVVGHQTGEQIINLLMQIKELPNET